MKKLIIYLLRRRLGLKVGELFQFANQNKMNENQYYFFTDSALMKKWKNEKSGREFISYSGVALNWLLNDECEIRIVEKRTEQHEQ